MDSRAGRHKKDELPPWDEDSQYSVMERQLYKWEHSLPNDHKWSLVLLRGYKADRQDLAYLGVTMMTRLCQMVVRREFLDDIIKGHPNDPNRERFFADMSLQLFQNVRELYEQIHAQFADRTRDESVGAQMAAFCVYSCGLFSTYLVKYPRSMFFSCPFLPLSNADNASVCPDPEISRMGPIMLRRTIDILTECKEVWPLATRWLRSLEKYDRDPKSTSIRFEGGMADGVSCSRHHLVVDGRPILTVSSTILYPLPFPGQSHFSSVRSRRRPSIAFHTRTRRSASSHRRQRGHPRRLPSCPLQRPRC